MKKNIEKIINAKRKPIEKGKGLSLCRFGGLNIVKQVNNYGKDGYHNAPEKYGFYAFPYPYIEPFLVVSTPGNDKSSKLFKVFNVSEGLIWSHFKPRKNKDIIEQKNDWYKTTIETYLKALKIDYATESGYMQSSGVFSRGNPYGIISKDHLEVFCTRDTVF